jgi:hypothetical protein
MVCTVAPTRHHRGHMRNKRALHRPSKTCRQILNALPPVDSAISPPPVVSLCCVPLSCPHAVSPCCTATTATATATAAAAVPAAAATAAGAANATAAADATAEGGFSWSLSPVISSWECLWCAFARATQRAWISWSTDNQKTYITKRTSLLSTYGPARTTPTVPAASHVPTAPSAPPSAARPTHPARRRRRRRPPRAA